MNIFTLSTSPVLSAQLLCDQHINKMILEGAQMLCTVAQEFTGKQSKLYRPTHQKHPCTQWVAARWTNANWLHNHICALNEERIQRFGQNTSHMSLLHATNAMGLILQYGSSELFTTPPPQCMPVQYQVLAEVPTWENTVQAYREYYKAKNREWSLTDRPGPMVWTNRARPKFMQSA